LPSALICEVFFVDAAKWLSVLAALIVAATSIWAIWPEDPPSRLTEDDPQYTGPMWHKEVISIDDMAAFLISMKKSLKATAEKKYQMQIEEKYTLAELASIIALQATRQTKFNNMVTYIAPFFDAMLAKKVEINACITYEQLCAIVI